ncbi:Ig-like domain-containing protein [Bacillus suaedaesalsae]|uniref:Bacterial Ig domain-containing protein n=1 Tax=Bacillus suaedaesalsae TaxID=2810349 RepID=A0ABS2DM66_9BACI|nr:Ig-like domain-containing protein [Bacillus suaedaesalsae]MBM6619155.1 hypothetical protein [Bacillus suaedaesalsae]
MKLFKRSTSLLLSCFLLFTSIPFTTISASATTVITPTEIPSTITEDLTLVKSNSPYSMKNNVTIESGATLRVEPGVEILGNVKQLTVQGNLDIQGSQEELVVLEDVYLNGQAGGTVSINFADWRKTGIAGVFNRNSTFSMKNSKFAYGSIQLSGTNVDAIISQNLFHNEGRLHVTGIVTEKVFIQGNTFYNHESRDIEVSCYTYNCTEPNNLVIQNNNFYNDHIHLYLTGDNNSPINVANNYWDTSILAKINGMIYDSMGLSTNTEVSPIATSAFPTVYALPTLETPQLEGDTAYEGTTFKGTAPNATKVVLKTKSISGNVVWHETTVNKGRFTFYVPRQLKGTVLELFSYTSNKTSEPKYYTVQPSFWNAKPIVYPVKPGSTVIEGLTKPETQVVVEQDNHIIGTGTSSATGEFEINISQQDDQNLLTVYSTFENQKTDPTTVIVKEKQESEAPSLTEVKLNYNQDFVTGITEPNTNLQVRVNNLSIGDSLSDSNGRFTVTFFNTQKGDIVEVTAVDTEGNRSESVLLEVIDIKQPTISPRAFSNADVFYTGRSETDVTIYIYNSTGTIITSGKTDNYGYYSIPIPRQEAGTWLKIEATDSSGNTTKVEQRVADYVSPIIEQVSTIYEGDTVIEGKTEPNAILELYVNEETSEKLQANSQGHFSYSVTGLVAGNKIKIIATDSSRNSSDPFITEVMPLVKIGAPEVDTISDQSNYITGKTSPNKKVEIYKETILVNEGISTSEGSFNIAIQKQPVGTKLTVVTLNERNQEGEPTIVTVVDKTAPEIPNIATTITDQTRLVSGTAEPLSYVVFSLNEEVIAKVNANDQGEFSADIPMITAHVELKFYAEDQAGNISLVKIIKVKDATPPIVTVNSVTNLTTTVTGVSSETGSVEVKIGSQLFNKTVSAGLPFSITIPVQKEGAMLTIISKDNYGNSSKPVTLIVKDVIAPGAPQVNKVTDQSKEISGKAEVGAVVRVYVGSRQIGYGTSNGAYKLTIPIQKAGTILTIKAIDKAGNSSKVTTIKVVDITAPNKPMFNAVKNNTTTASGKAEPGSIVRLYSGTRIIGYGTSTSKGTFSIRIPVQKVGVKLTANATDLSGNKSSTTYITVLDGIAPGAPKVNAVYSKSYYVTGKAEAYSTVKVKRGTTILGTAKADRYGKYKLKISRQKRGVTLGVSSTDASKNESEQTYIKVR